MKAEIYYSHTISRDVKSEDEWRAVAQEEGWDFERAVRYEFLVMLYRIVRSPSGLQMFF